MIAADNTLHLPRKPDPSFAGGGKGWPGLPERPKDAAGFAKMVAIERTRLV